MRSIPAWQGACIGHNGRTMPSPIAPTREAGPTERLAQIQHARRELLHQQRGGGSALLAPWIERSWQRCMGSGHQPGETVGFDLLSAGTMRRTREANYALTKAARPVLQELGQALAATRYFAILTNAQGVVVDVNGPINRSDRRAHLISRIGVDLSERSIGTSAISAALAELQPVWLHRGEHFFDDTSAYSCAGAPLFGAHGECVGMLDVTGVDVPERPELKHLLTRYARSIENILVQEPAHQLLLRLSWPGQQPGADSDGLVTLDADGFVVGCNTTARQMIPPLALAQTHPGSRCHSHALFAVAFEMLFDATRRGAQPIALPLWSGLQVQAVALPSKGLHMAAARRPALGPVPVDTGVPRRLKDIETALIRKAVVDARGNVALAATRLGVSRATVYRKLGIK